ncbi:MFS transporter [Nocardiopsis mangrovi]|uniref:MFS transporter n=1 Tax=Nocardiopsis mangrovi TaxID=1179818 RepID=A0ABV9DX90_9ACTN
MSATEVVSGTGGGAAPLPRSGSVITALATAGIVVAVMQTVMIPIVPALPALIGASVADASWALTAPLLAGAVATPVAGRLGDMFGKRRVLLASLGILVAGSLVGAFSSSLVPLVVGRALQGCAMGVIPLGISLMRDELPPERLGSAIGLMSSSLGVGGALGLPAAAAVAQYADWHALFWASALMGAVALVWVARAVPESAQRSGGRFDAVGAVGLSIGLTCLLLAVSKGGAWGWTSTTTVGLLATAAVVFTGWALWELRAPDPLVDLRTTVRRQVLLTNITSVAVGFSMFAQALVLPQLLQLPESTGYGLGRSMLVAGACVAPGGLMMLFISPVAARVAKAWGSKASLMIGTVIITAGYALGLVFLDEVWQIVVVGCVIGCGVAMAYSALPALIMSAVPTSETAAANGFNALMRSIGTSTASAVTGVVLAYTTTQVGSLEVPTLDGFRAALAIGAVAALAGLALAAFIPGRPRTVVGAARP